MNLHRQNLLGRSTNKRNKNLSLDTNFKNLLLLGLAVLGHGSSGTCLKSPGYTGKEIGQGFPKFAKRNAKISLR